GGGAGGGGRPRRASAGRMGGGPAATDAPSSGSWPRSPRSSGATKPPSCASNSRAPGATPTRHFARRISEVGRIMRWIALTLLAASLPASTMAAEPEWPVIQSGRAGLYWSFSLRYNPEAVPPGGVIANEARWSEPPQTGAVIWYFAGVNAQTVHIFVIFQEFSKAAGRVLEIERRPIYLTLDDD